MKKRTRILCIIIILLGTHSLRAQVVQTITGKVVSPYNNAPIAGSVITSSDGSVQVVTDSTGNFSIEVPSLSPTLEVWAPGYYSQSRPAISAQMLFVMIPQDKLNYNETFLTPFERKGLQNKATAGTNLSKSDFSKGGLFINNVLEGAIPGLQVIEGSGMPGEGSYMNARGINTLIGKASPLIIIDGVPFIPDMSESPVIGGFTSNIFNAYSAADIKNITYLKGAEAAMYGSMGSNGILIIETDDATDLETRVSFVSQYGMSENSRTMPLLGIGDYKSYLGDVALTYFEDMGDILTEFPFLQDDPNYYYNYLYNNQSDWQSMVMNPAFTTENILKIKGGDAIAKYDLSFGYLDKGGVVKGTGLSRYNMRLNSSINISQKINLFASMSLAYLTNNLQEQGIIPQTNPIIASMAKSPLLSPYRKENENILPDYATIRDEDGNVRVGDAFSNPLAIVNTTNISSEGSDVVMNGGINYNVTGNFKLSGVIGLYNQYTRSEVFVPGVSNGSIMPLEDGLANNTVRDGIRETFNMYYSVNGRYQKTFAKRHALSLVSGWQMLTIRKEFDAGEGRNTSSDFYKTLDNVNSIGRSFYGYIYKWNWMNAFTQANYTYNDLYSAGLTFSFDGSSSTGNATSQTGFFPALNVAANLHNLPVFSNQSAMNNLVVRAEYVKTGNSEFHSNLSDYYYHNQVFRELSGIVRDNIPNTKLSWENTSTLNAGLDFSGFKHRLDVTLDVYHQLSSDVILAKSISPAFGMDFTYDNLAQIQNQGIELGLQAYIIDTRRFDWLIGGTLANNQNKVMSLGGESDKIIEFQDGTAVITREGEAVYSFYGYQTDGVYSTSADAESSGLTDFAGNSFGAGDMRFVNVNDSDSKIDDQDRVIIGNPNPDFFGRVYSTISFGRLSLFANFIYSYGNDAYNGLRREFETMDNFGNQLISAQRRWQTEGQITDLPRAIYGDPMGNGRFSDRWIEDASFIKLKELTLSFDLKRGDLNFLQGGTIYISGENLLTLTKYLGFDPEFSYSYSPYKQGLDLAKVPVMRTLKLGFKLHF
ncbi:MAG: SusC/RagA family TonB-linked outer membrane protein [Prolixibacteraceae bacterium]